MRNQTEGSRWRFKNWQTASNSHVQNISKYFPAFPNTTPKIALQTYVVQATFSQAKSLTGQRVAAGLYGILPSTSYVMKSSWATRSVLALTGTFMSTHFQRTHDQGVDFNYSCDLRLFDSTPIDQSSNHVGLGLLSYFEAAGDSMIWPFMAWRQISNRYSRYSRHLRNQDISWAAACNANRKMMKDKNQPIGFKIDHMERIKNHPQLACAK